MKYLDYLNLLKNRKKRLTPGRKNIIKLFCDAPAPLPADFLIGKTGLNKTSVYREIDFLLSENIIQDVDFCDGTKRYELKDLEHHHHLICLKCKKVEDIVLEEGLGKAEEKISKTANFHVIRHNLEFFGYCESCQK